MSQKTNINQSIQVANTIGQVGCVIGFVAIIIIAAAFGAGTLIDRWMDNERQWATIILMLGSFPITLYAMIQISLRTMARANAKVEQLKQSQIAQEDNLKE
ncbi:MAG: hypothetical protein AB8G95_22020 [Anaerolineae bacterium]